MKKYCALRFNSNTLNTRVLGFGDYSDCENIIMSDDFYNEVNYHHFILHSDNKISQGYIQKDLLCIIQNVASCLKIMDARAYTKPSIYLDFKDILYNTILKGVDDLINNSL